MAWDHLPDYEDDIPTQSEVMDRPPAVSMREGFPVEILPAPFAEYVRQSAECIGCDESAIAMPLLSALSAAVGNSAIIEVRRGWTESCNIWTGIIGESGTNKSTALAAGTKFTRERHQRMTRNYLDGLHVYECELAEWKARKGDKKRGNEPAPPTNIQCLMQDATVEAAVEVLAYNSRGVLLERDELAGWIGSFNQYKTNGGGDVAHWLGMFRAESITINRKTNNYFRHIERAFVAITGGIQPAILSRAISGENTENGLAARFLFVRPPTTPKRWIESEVDPRIEDDAAAVTERLFGLECGQNPAVIPFDESARAKFARFYEDHANETEQCDGALRAAFSKLEGYCARFALIFHLVDIVSGRIPTDHNRVQADSVRRAIILTKWLGKESERIYGSLGGGNPEIEDLMKFIIEEHGGTISARELAHKKKRYRKAGKAEEALEMLIASKLGKWTTKPTNGRPASIFEIAVSGNGSL